MVDLWQGEISMHSRTTALNPCHYPLAWKTLLQMCLLAVALSGCQPQSTQPAIEILSNGEVANFAAIDPAVPDGPSQDALEAVQLALKAQLMQPFRLYLSEQVVNTSLFSTGDVVELYMIPAEYMPPGRLRVLPSNEAESPNGDGIQHPKDETRDNGMIARNFELFFSLVFNPNFADSLTDVRRLGTATYRGEPTTVYVFSGELFVLGGNGRHLVFIRDSDHVPVYFFSLYESRNSSKATVVRFEYD
jgi:hypothetical protein